MTMNIFEYAARNKVRFQSTKGELSFEQLWDLPLRPKDSKDDFHLDAVARAANKAWKEISEESFVKTGKTSEHTRREVTFEIVKYVIATKLVDEEVAKTRVSRKLEKEQLLSVLAEKQLGKLSDLSVKALKERIAALEE
jgi:hypothetical protein